MSGDRPSERGPASTPPSGQPEKDARSSSSGGRKERRSKSMRAIAPDDTTPDLLNSVSGKVTLRIPEVDAIRSDASDVSLDFGSTPDLGADDNFALAKREPPPSVTVLDTGELLPVTGDEIAEGGAPLSRAPTSSDAAELELTPDDVMSVESVPKPAANAPPPRPAAQVPSAPPAPPPPPTSNPRLSDPGEGIAVPTLRAEEHSSPALDAALSRKKGRPWWEELFNDDFIRTMAKVSEDQIAAEAAFIEESLGCEAGATLLDLGCGTGRHAVEFAARGYEVVGLDLSLAMLARASELAQENYRKINFVQGDMREMVFEEAFDGVYSWNTSFGYFDEEKNAAVIARIQRSLKKGGRFLMDVVNRDYIIHQSPSLAWFEGDGCICMDEMSFDFLSSRMKVKRSFMMDDGRTKEIEYSVRAYSIHELGKLLNENGFRVAEVSGRTGTPGVFFGCESPRALILAEKR
jgi:SAM-dependent methyltransferase